jgi:Putative prokaryotic signal transducing protein
MNFVHLRSFDNYVQANIQLGMLQDKGINCHLRDEYTTTIDPLLSNAIGGMKLMVFETQAGRALQLIQAAEDANQESLADGDSGLSDWPAEMTSRILQKLSTLLARSLGRKEPELRD